MNVDIFEKKQFSLLFSIVYRVSFISHLHAFLVSVCTKGFPYLLCRPRGRGLGLLVCKRRFSFREIYNFLLFNFFLPKLAFRLSRVHLPLEKFTQVSEIVVQTFKRTNGKAFAKSIWEKSKKMYEHVAFLVECVS